MSRVLVNKPQPLEARFVKERDLVQLSFGKRLRALRTEQKLTLQILAERADLHENYVGAVERGERNLSLYNVWRLAAGLGLSANDLVQDLPRRKGKSSKSA
jgi:transcriptional regulator with XRE-family HTH domain